VTAQRLLIRVISGCGDHSTPPD